MANSKTLNYTARGLSDSEFTEVMGIKIAKDVRDKLIHIYEGDDKVKKAKLQNYRRQFESLKMNDEEDIVAYFI